MSGNPENIELTPLLRQTLLDWNTMVRHLASHPTSVLQLVSATPHYISYTDACGLGAGGVWCSGTKPLQTFLWQLEWPQDVRAALCTDKNPKGTLSINTLELAGAVIAFLILEYRL